MNYQMGKSGLLVLAVAWVCLNTVVARGDVVYVWSYDGVITRFDENGNSTILTNNFSGWNGPVGLALDSSGSLYAGVPGDSYIWKFPANGPPSKVGDVDSVSGLAFDGTGNLYATIPNYAEVLRLAYHPIFGYYIGLTNYSQSHLSYPISLAFDKMGTVFVANSRSPWSASPFTNTIEKYSPSCIHLGTFAADLNGPWGLAFDDLGNLYVSNSGTNVALRNNIVKFTPGGIRTFFSSAGMNQPRGLAFDSAGNLYVANAGDGTIRKFPPGGLSVSTFASGLNGPSSIAIHPGIKFWKATSIMLVNPASLPGGTFRFTFTNTPTVGFNVLATTNPLLPASNWVSLGGVTETALGQFEFTDSQASNHLQRFYRVYAP